MFQSNLLGAIT